MGTKSITNGAQEQSCSTNHFDHFLRDKFSPIEYSIKHPNKCNGNVCNMNNKNDITRMPPNIYSKLKDKQ